MISSQSPSSYPRAESLDDGAAISENGATKLREAERPTDTFVNTPGKKEENAGRAVASLSLSLCRRCRYKDHSCHFAMTKLCPEFSVSLVPREAAPARASPRRAPRRADPPRLIILRICSLEFEV